MSARPYTESVVMASAKLCMGRKKRFWSLVSFGAQLKNRRFNVHQATPPTKPGVVSIFGVSFFHDNLLLMKNIKFLPLIWLISWVVLAITIQLTAGSNDKLAGKMWAQKFDNSQNIRLWFFFGNAKFQKSNSWMDTSKEEFSEISLCKT